MVDANVENVNIRCHNKNSGQFKHGHFEESWMSSCHKHGKHMQLQSDLGKSFTQETKIQPCSKENGLGIAKDGLKITGNNIIIDKVDENLIDTLEGLESYVKEEEKEFKYEPGNTNLFEDSVELEKGMGKGKSKIYFAEVAAIVGRRSLGVFARNEIKAGTILGTYTGKRQKISNSDKNGEYKFSLSNGEEVDAKDQGNWTRFVNHAPCGVANVASIYEEIENEREICFIAIKDISADSQLLLDYGGEYFSELGVKPLNLYPTDNHETPSQRYHSKRDAYHDHVIELDEEVARSLGYNEKKYFVVPGSFATVYQMYLNEKKLEGAELSEEEKTKLEREIKEGKEKLEEKVKGVVLDWLNASIYAVKRNDDGKWEFYEYNEQQQVTSLMLACYLGQEELVRCLLNNEGTRLTLHGGRSALSFAVLGKGKQKEKEKILKLLFKKAGELSGDIIKASSRKLKSYKGDKNFKDLVDSIIEDVKGKVNADANLVDQSLYVSDSSLFDCIMDGKQYELCEKLFEKCSDNWKQKIAEKFTQEGRIFDIVLDLDKIDERERDQYIKVADSLLNKILADSIPEKKPREGVFLKLVKNAQEFESFKNGNIGKLLCIIYHYGKNLLSCMVDEKQ